MKHFTTILFLLFSTQIFCQIFSEKFELAYQNNSQKELIRALDELALDNLTRTEIPDSLIELFNIYDVLINHNDKYCFIQTELLYSFVDASNIDFFLSTENIQFDTINLFTPIINSKRPKLISLDNKLVSAFRKFINVEGIDKSTLSQETKRAIDKSLKNGRLVMEPKNENLLIINSIGKTISREELSRQLASHRRIEFLQKQIRLSVGDVNQGVWEFEIIKNPNVRYMIMDYQMRKAWVLNVDCLTEMILVKDKNDRWIIKGSINTGCL